MKVYIVLSDYDHIDYDFTNYTTILGVYSSKEKALEAAKEEAESQLGTVKETYSNSDILEPSLKQIEEGFGTGYEVVVERIGYVLWENAEPKPVHYKNKNDYMEEEKWTFSVEEWDVKD